MKLIVEYEPMVPAKLSQDPSFTGEGWTFAPTEHDEITFPHSILATDAEGRSYTYLARSGVRSRSRRSNACREEK